MDFATFNNNTWVDPFFFSESPSTVPSSTTASSCMDLLNLGSAPDNMADLLLDWSANSLQQHQQQPIQQQQPLQHVVFLPAETAANILSGQQSPIFLIPSPTVPGSYVPAVATASYQSHVIQQQQQEQQFLPSPPQQTNTSIPLIDFQRQSSFSPVPSSTGGYSVCGSPQLLDNKDILESLLSTPPMSPPNSIMDELFSLPSPSTFEDIDLSCFFNLDAGSASPSLSPCPEAAPAPAVAPINPNNNNNNKKRSHSEDSDDQIDLSIVKRQRSSSTCMTPSRRNSIMIKSEIPSTTTKPGNSHQCPHPGCLKTFNRRSHLVSHIVTHTDQKNFSCELCNAVFARCHDLQRHQRTKHIAGGGKAFACGSCGLGFARKDSMKKHLDKHCKVLHGAAGSA